MLTSLWFDHFVNWLSGAVTEIGIITAQAVMIGLVWILPPVATVTVALACGCALGVALFWGVTWVLVWSLALWFAGRQERRAKFGAAMREQNRLAASAG